MSCPHCRMIMSSFGKSEVILLNDAQSRLGAYRRRISTGWCLLPGSNPVSVMSWRSCREVDIKCLENCVATYIHTLSSFPCHRLNFGKKSSFTFLLKHIHTFVLSAASNALFFSDKRWLSTQLGREGGSVNHIKESVSGNPRKICGRQ